MAIGVPFLIRYCKNAIRLQLNPLTPPDPLILTYFVTFRCNLHCTYCDYAGDGYASRFPELATEEAIAILRICRKGIPSVAFSGGEPLVRADIVEIVREAKKIGYRPVSLFTNGLELHRREEILNYVDYLQISLDSVHEDTQDALRQREGLGKRLKSTIRHYAALQRDAHFRLNINCVLTPMNLGGVQELMEFAHEARVRLSCCPMLDSQGQPDPSLRSTENRSAYREAIEKIRAFKNKTGDVIDINPFLNHINEFNPGPCFPTLTPRVYPDGSLRLMCAVHSDATANILKLGSWENVQKVLRRTAEPCPKACFLPCYLETSLLAAHPTQILQELFPIKTEWFHRFATAPDTRD
jgi:MoaA/NifB/PqqE/SkfB family radical SAM enzyme